MSVHVVESSPHGITIQITVSFGISMLDFETQLQQQLNEAGNLATAEQLRRFDTDGSPLQVGPTTLYSKGQLPKEYQPPTAPSRSNATSISRLTGARRFAPSSARRGSS